MVFTHKGRVRQVWGSASVKFRETKCFWISEAGEKFRKTTGSRVGNGTWDCTRLDLNSITEIDHDKQR